MTAIGFMILVAAMPGLVYGLVDILFPQVTLRWQVRSTARSHGLRRSVGTGFQRWLSIDPAKEPWNDQQAKRRMRLVGASLTATSTALAGLGAALIAWS